MKIFKLIQIRFDQFEQTVRDYLASQLAGLNINFSNSGVFGQMINVFASAVQNILTYIEDSITELNKYTASRKRSIYNLASISGYNPSLGTATSCTIKLSFKPSNNNVDVILNNKTRIKCKQNNMNYNILLPQEAIVLSPSHNNSSRYLNIVEGTFENQSFVAHGGQLYTSNIKFSGDCDIDYTEVYVNNELWERRDSLYDMDPEGKQYVIRTGLKNGIDIIFGTGQNGKTLEDGDYVNVIYLIHNGEYGNVNASEAIDFEFESSLQDSLGNDVDGNEMFDITLPEISGVYGGTFSESIENVRQMIGLNSRSLVLADPKNYKQYLNKFSFVGYNRVWSETGSLVINSIIMSKYSNKIKEGKDYFDLQPSDFYLSTEQKNTIKNNIINSGSALAGSVFNIFDPELAKYAMYIYIKLKDNSYDTNYITGQVRNEIGKFFSDIKSDIFIPKSDIIQLLKNNIPQIDGVNIYILSDNNEQAIKNTYYIKKEYKYNPSRGTYDIKQTLVNLYDGENPNLGLDNHGNIWLDNPNQYPVLMGGWSFRSADNINENITINDPLTIIYE